VPYNDEIRDIDEIPSSPDSKSLRPIVLFRARLLKVRAIIIEIIPILFIIRFIFDGCLSFMGGLEFSLD
jgi:hypothetical protein